MRKEKEDVAPEGEDVDFGGDLGRGGRGVDVGDEAGVAEGVGGGGGSGGLGWGGGVHGGWWRCC